MANDYPTEHEEQKAFVEWVREAHPSLLIFAIPNGGARDVIEGRRLKQAGVTAGAPDLCILLPEQTLFIEMKTRNLKQGKTLTQEIFGKRIVSLGHFYHICFGYLEARGILEKYIARNEKCPAGLKTQ